MKSILISHSNLEPDKTISLQLYKYLSAQKIDCWIDALLEADEWDEQIGKVMFSAPVVIFVASKNSMVSKDCIREVRYFLKTPGKTIIPFVIDSQYYLNPDDEAARFIYNFGDNSLQAVFADKFPDLETAFARLASLLPADIGRTENDASDFVYGESEKRLTAYNGSDGCVTIPPYVTEICRGAFQNNDALKKVVIPPSVEKIGIRAFFGCKNLLCIDGMDGLKEAEASALDGSGIAPCTENDYSYGGIKFGCDEDAESLVVADGIRIIANEAFRYCNAKTVTLPQGLQTIGELAFADSILIERIVIPASVVRIGKNAFRGCDKLREVVFDGEIPDGAEAAFERFDAIVKR